MNSQTSNAAHDLQVMVSPYLLRPIRTKDQAAADMRNSRRSTNIHSFFPAVTSKDVPSVTRTSAA